MHALRSLLPVCTWAGSCAEVVQGGVSSGSVLPPTPRWAWEECWIEEPRASTFKELRLKPHSVPKSFILTFLCPENILVYLMELEAYFSSAL